MSANKSNTRIAKRLLGQKTTWLRRVAAAALLFISGTLHADDSRLLGPLRIQDMSPLALLRLDMLPAPAQSDAKWRFELASSNANMFSMSAAAQEYLETRGDDRTPLTVSDAHEMLKSGEQMFFFDGEVTVTNFIITRKTSKRTEVEIVLPYHAFGGGRLDTVIEGFHRGVGLNDAGRTLVPRNGVTVVSRVGTGERVMVNDDGDSGFGDATLTLRYRDQFAMRWSYVVETAARFPTGKEELYFSNSSMNYGVQASIQRKSERNGLYASASYVLPGKTRMLQATELKNVPSVLAGYERALGKRMSAIVQATWSSGGFTDASVPDMTRVRKQISLGMRRHYKSSAVWVALTENVGSFKNTPDIGVHAGITYVR